MMTLISHGEIVSRQEWSTSKGQDSSSEKSLSSLYTVTQKTRT